MRRKVEMCNAWCCYSSQGAKDVPPGLSRRFPIRQKDRMAWVRSSTFDTVKRNSPFDILRAMHTEGSATD